MKQKKNTKSLGIIMSTFLFASLMIFASSCDPAEEEVCEEVEELCEEPVTVCSNTSTEYYIFDGDTIDCIAVGDCSSVTLKIANSCTLVASAKETDIKVRLKAIMANVRSLNY